METRLQSNEIRVPKPEFEYNSQEPCQYFKSAFARSLSFSNNKTKSLDIGINFGLNKNCENETIAEDALFVINSQVDCGSDVTPENIKNVWRKSQEVKSSRRCSDLAEKEVIRLRKECESLIQENRRLLNLNSVDTSENLLVQNNNVESVLLQTQVDTLQWQLKQVESSRQMYRAVMEEVVRFLGRCHRSLDAIQNEPISRSKSVHQVCCQDDINKSPRTRSSTNLIDVQKSCLRQDSISASSAGSYSNFRDFTWRRMPKQASNTNNCPASNEFEPEKLSQEAFRLYRTASNLLNTQEPNLIPYKSSIDDSQHSQQFCIPFDRKLNMRYSRTSLRSSTDDSVHSNSSIKSETDEECRERQSHQVLPIPAHQNAIERLKDIIINSTEDESGFSSMNSFQEIGLPLINSTMLAQDSSSSTGSTSDETTNFESNSTIKREYKNLKLSATKSPQKIGLPVSYNHRRWDSAPVVSPKKMSSFSGDETLRVLWV